MMAAWEVVGAGVVAIDTEYVRPRMDASHLLVDGDHAAFIDTGTSFSVPNLLAALAAQDLAPEAVDWVILTHIHLDHAGGAGQLIAALPRARVLVHPRGLAHMVDPTKLIEATRAVYGDAHYAEMYGEILPIPAARIEAVADGQRVALGARTFEFLHTPGHALHHVCIVDREAAIAFTGDTFGLSYREFDTATGPFIFATTTPSQFDPVQLHASVDRVVQCRPSSAYLTHYSRVDGIEALAADLHADIDAFVDIARRAPETPDRPKFIEPRLFEHLEARLAAHGYTGGSARAHELLDADVSLNADGLHAWLSRRK